MSWTNPQKLSAADELFEKLRELPMRDHVNVVATITLCQAFKDHQNVELTHFKDLAFACGRSIKHISACDTLKFLMEHLEKAPEAMTAKDVLVVLALMGLKAQEAADKALRDVQRLAGLLPEEEASSASQ